MLLIKSLRENMACDIVAPLIRDVRSQRCLRNVGHVGNLRFLPGSVTKSRARGSRKSVLQYFPERVCKFDENLFHVTFIAHVENPNEFISLASRLINRRFARNPVCAALIFITAARGILQTRAAKTDPIKNRREVNLRYGVEFLINRVWQLSRKPLTLLSGFISSPYDSATHRVRTIYAPVVPVNHPLSFQIYQSSGCSFITPTFMSPTCYARRCCNLQAPRGSSMINRVTICI